ncbi:MAG: hypothetical protein Q4G16_02740 [Cruoricaptor ignavus]|nr:hypothetical protein [Cruoricaptor ignavus]
MFSLILISCKDRDSEKDGVYTYEGTMVDGHACGYIIYMKDNGGEYFKPINLEKEYEEGGTKVIVTFSYTSEIVNGFCSGFLQYSREIKIIGIVKI